MKRIIFACFIILAAAPVVANHYFIDVYGAYADIGSDIHQLGGGGAAGFSVYRTLSVLYRGMYTVLSRPSSFPVGPRHYNHMTHLVGLEYVLAIPVIRIGWRTSFMAGYSRTRIDTADIERNFMESVMLSQLPTPPPNTMLMLNLFKVRHLRDGGPSLAFWTGFQLVAVPFIAPFVDIGIHKSFYDEDLKGKKIIGFHLMFGVRLIFSSGDME